MTDFRDIPDTELDPGAPATDLLFQALRDNPVAIAEGAAGAPSVLPNYGANGQYNGIGSYVFARYISGDAGGGATVAGSTLRATSAFRSVSDPGNNSSIFSPSMAETSGLAGTWRCMGYADSNAASAAGGGSAIGATLWLRIS